MVTILTRASFEIVLVYNCYVVLVKHVDRRSHEWVDFLFKSTLSSFVLDKVFLLMEWRTLSVRSAGDRV